MHTDKIQLSLQVISLLHRIICQNESCSLDGNFLKKYLYIYAMWILEAPLLEF